MATLGPRERINLTALWFGCAGGKVYAFTRGQKVAPGSVDSRDPR
jgi:hypothetical protein